MSDPSLVVVVRGTGSIGRQYLHALGHLRPRPHIVAWPVSSAPNPSRGPLPADVIGDPGVADDGATLAWIVASDTGRHIGDAVDAMRRGAGAILVEKPVATSVAEAVPLRAEPHAGQKVFVSAPLRFQSAMRCFREQLRRIGDVHSVRIECQSYLPDWRPGTDYRASYSARANEGGVLRDLIHEIDYSCWLFGAPSAVGGRLSSLGRLGIRSEETADVWWTLPNGATVSIRLDYLTRPGRRRMTACGSNGTIEWDGMAQTVDLRLADGTHETQHAPDARGAALARQVDAFVAIASSRPRSAELPTLTEGLTALAICDAVRRASVSGSDEPVRDS